VRAGRAARFGPREGGLPAGPGRSGRRRRPARVPTGPAQEAGESPLVNLRQPEPPDQAAARPLFGVDTRIVAGLGRQYQATGDGIHDSAGRAASSWDSSRARAVMREGPYQVRARPETSATR
jgi:hypothetical protein